MTADVAEVAWGEQIDPPAITYARLLGARDDVFRLIGGHQQPHHTTTLYKIASQITAMLAMVTFDLGYPHAANPHARTALHCAEVSGHTPIRVFLRRVQSSIAISEGRYDEAAELMAAARPDATSGTTLLRLTSQQARINAARNRPDEVTRALVLAETAPTERTADEPGVLGFDPAWAARTAGDAHYALGNSNQVPPPDNRRCAQCSRSLTEACSRSGRCPGPCCRGNGEPVSGRPRLSVSYAMWTIDSRLPSPRPRQAVVLS